MTVLDYFLSLLGVVAGLIVRIERVKRIRWFWRELEDAEWSGCVGCGVGFGGWSCVKEFAGYD